VKYAWIKDHRTEFPIAIMCRVLDVCRSAFYQWLRNPDRVRQQRQQAIVEQIKIIRQERFILQSQEKTQFARLHQPRKFRGEPELRYIPRVRRSWGRPCCLT